MFPFENVGPMTRLLPVFLIFLIQAPRTLDGPVGVLVGIQTRGNDRLQQPASGGSLRTVWISMNQTSGSPPRVEAVEIPDLLVPRRSRFWRAGLLGTCAERRAEAI